MATFDELLGKLKNADDENPLPDDYHDQLETAYVQSLETYDAKIKDLEQQNSALDDKVKEYAVANYDLTRKTGVNEPPKNRENEPPKRPTTAELVAKMRGKTS